MKNGTVFAPVHGLDLVPGLIFELRPQRGKQLVGIRKAGIPVADVHTDNFFPPITQHLAKRVAGFYYVTFDAEDMDAVAGVVQ